MHASAHNRSTKLARSEPHLLQRLTGADRIVYAPAQLMQLFRSMRTEGLYAKHTTYEDFLEFALRRRHLAQVELYAANYDKTILRFCRGQARGAADNRTIRSHLLRDPSRAYFNRHCSQTRVCRRHPICVGMFRGGAPDSFN
jgi:hypothetical protein